MIRRTSITFPTLALVAVALMVVAGCQSSQRSVPSSQQPAPPSTSSPPSPVSLPFAGLEIYPRGVAVDTAGNLYITTTYPDQRVLKLPVGSNTPVELPFTDLREPGGVAVDTAGNVYVADGPVVRDNGAYLSGRVLKLVAGSNTQVELPFTGLYTPSGVAVDAAGNVYLANLHIPPDSRSRALKLPVGSNTQVELPFTGLVGPEGVAVDTAGNVYVGDGRRLLKLPAGSNTQVELPVSGIDILGGVAVDGAGNVYITDRSENHAGVFKLAVGSKAQVRVPFTGLQYAFGVAVDTAGDVYVADAHTPPSKLNRVLKLPAG